MTTNSPNPVDGDVQALIADCQAEIVEIEKALTTWGDAWIPSLQSKLKRQQVALAALTAKPEYNVSFEGGEIRLDVTKAEYNGCHPDYRWISYTTPPAQILRPVELPGLKECPQEHLGSQLWDEINVWNKAIDACAESLRQQGYEVKS